MFLLKSLHKEECVERFTVVFNDTNSSIHIALAQGSIINFYCIKGNEIKLYESFPMVSPIIGITSSVETHDVFIILRNFNWFVFRDAELVNSGSFKELQQSLAERSIINSSDLLSCGSISGNAISTATIRFYEKRILLVSHPSYVALSLFSNSIYLVPYSSQNKMIEIPIMLPNVVDIAFIGPLNFSIRLAVLTDSHNDNRVLTVYNIILASASWKIEFLVDLPKNAHSILPLQATYESSALVFTNDGVVRITAPQGLPQKIEHISAFLEDTILNHCPFYDDVYLITDASGGLSVGKFPIEARPVTERIQNIGPVSSMVAFDRTRFFISTPFGDSILYGCDITDEGCLLNEISRIPTISFISSIYNHPFGGLVSLIGRGEMATLTIFEQMVECEKVGSFFSDGCLSVHTASIGAVLYVCLSFYSTFHIIKMEGSDISNVDLPSETENFPVLHFSSSGERLLIVTTNGVYLFEPGSNEFAFKHEYGEQINSASSSSCIIALSSESGYLRSLNPNNLSSIKKWRIKPRIHHVTVCENIISALLSDCSIFYIESPNYESKTNIIIPNNIIPYSFGIHLQEGKPSICISTEDGRVYKMKPSKPEPEEIGVNGGLITFKQYGNSLVASGSSPFIIQDHKSFIHCDSCDDISISSGYVVSLSAGIVSVYRKLGDMSVSPKKLVSIPNAVTFVPLGNDGSMTVLVQNNENYSIKKYDPANQSSSFCIEEKISLFSKISICGIQYLVYGEKNGNIRILDVNNNLVAQFKTHDSPISICVHQEYIIVSCGKEILVYTFLIIEGAIELERKFETSTQTFTIDLCSSEKFFVAADASNGLSILEVNENGIGLIWSDYCSKDIKKVFLFNNYIFAASYSSILYIYEYNEKGIFDIGCTMTSSVITSFAINEGSLYYSTEKGGLYNISLCNNQKLTILNDLILSENVKLLDDLSLSSMLNIETKSPIIKFDTISFIKRLPNKSMNRLLQKSGLSLEQINDM